SNTEGCGLLAASCWLPVLGVPACLKDPNKFVHAERSEAPVCRKERGLRNPDKARANSTHRASRRASLALWRFSANGLFIRCRFGRASRQLRTSRRWFRNKRGEIGKKSPLGPAPGSIGCHDEREVLPPATGRRQWIGRTLVGAEYSFSARKSLTQIPGAPKP